MILLGMVEPGQWVRLSPSWPAMRVWSQSPRVTWLGDEQGVRIKLQSNQGPVEIVQPEGGGG